MHPGVIVRKNREFVVTVLKTRNVSDAYVVELNVSFGFRDLIQPRLDFQQIEAEYVALQLVGRVVHVIERHQLHEIGCFLHLSQVRETERSQKQ